MGPGSVADTRTGFLEPIPNGRMPRSALMQWGSARSYFNLICHALVAHMAYSF